MSLNPQYIYIDVEFDYIRIPAATICHRMKFAIICHPGHVVIKYWFTLIYQRAYDKWLWNIVSVFCNFQMFRLTDVCLSSMWTRDPHRSHLWLWCWLSTPALLDSLYHCSVHPALCTVSRDRWLEWLNSPRGICMTRYELTRAMDIYG